MGFILAIPGLFRTLSTGFLIAADLSNELAPLAGQNLSKAALVTAVIGIGRALIRKVYK